MSVPVLFWMSMTCDVMFTGAVHRAMQAVGLPHCLLASLCGVWSAPLQAVHICFCQAHGIAKE